MAVHLHSSAGSGAADTNVEVASFVASGAFRADAQVDGRWYNRTGKALTIGDVTLHREFAGGSGTTTVDVGVDGASIFATAGDRPSVSSGDGDDAVDQGGTLATSTIADGSYLSMDIDSAETGGRRNLSVRVTLSS